MRVRNLRLHDHEHAVLRVVREDHTLLAAVGAVLGHEVDAVHERGREERVDVVELEAFDAVAFDGVAIERGLSVRRLVAAVNGVRELPLVGSGVAVDDLMIEAEPVLAQSFVRAERVEGGTEVDAAESLDVELHEDAFGIEQAVRRDAHRRIFDDVDADAQSSTSKVDDFATDLERVDDERLVSAEDGEELDCVAQQVRIDDGARRPGAAAPARSRRATGSDRTAAPARGTVLATRAAGKAVESAVPDDRALAREGAASSTAAPACDAAAAPPESTRSMNQPSWQPDVVVAREKDGSELTRRRRAVLAEQEIDRCAGPVIDNLENRVSQPIHPPGLSGRLERQAHRARVGRLRPRIAPIRRASRQLRNAERRSEGETRPHPISDTHLCFLSPFRTSERAPERAILMPRAEAEKTRRFTISLCQ